MTWVFSRSYSYRLEYPLFNSATMGIKCRHQRCGVKGLHPRPTIPGFILPVEVHFPLRATSASSCLASHCDTNRISHICSALFSFTYTSQVLGRPPHGVFLKWNNTFSCSARLALSIVAPGSSVPAALIRDWPKLFYSVSRPPGLPRAAHSCFVPLGRVGWPHVGTDLSIRGTITNSALGSNRPPPLLHTVGGGIFRS